MALRTLLLTIAVAAVAGCGSDTHPVTGKVTFKDGEPVSDARVIFRSALDGEHISAFATTDENGEYSLTTWQTDDGAVPGEHKVIVTKPRQIDENHADGTKLLPREIHQSYADFGDTPLKFNVEKDRMRANEVGGPFTPVRLFNCRLLGQR